MGPDGRPTGATAAARIAAPPARVWEVVSDLSGYAERLPMVHRVKRDGDRVQVDLRFKIALFSVGFAFQADARYEAERWLELTWVEGEPRGIVLRFDLHPHADGKETLMYGSGAFDIRSLGWLVKFFLKHHPEIEFGIFPGVALNLIDAMRKAAVGA
jgi:hypothetical protein